MLLADMPLNRIPIGVKREEDDVQEIQRLQLFALPDYSSVAVKSNKRDPCRS